jgi:hypothetical protein
MRRTLALGAAWAASAAAAVGLGFLAVSLVDASASTTAASSSSPVVVSAGDDRTPAATPTPGPTTAERATDGGTVLASCTGTSPAVAGAPAAGWRIDDSGAAGSIEFRNADSRVEVRVDCSSGTPQFTVEGPGADQSGSDDSTSRSSAATSTSSTSEHPAGDDNGGAPTSTAGSGGHGADDPAGDDSSGRTGGGHGSDG